MVGYRDGPEGALQLIDVFENGKELTVEQAALQLSDTGEFSEEMLAPTTKRAIFLRMLRNLLSTTFEASRSLRDSLSYFNLILAVDPKSQPDRDIRSQLHERLGDKAAARSDLQWLIEHFPEDGDPSVLQHLDARLQSLRR